MTREQRAALDAIEAVCWRSLRGLSTEFEQDPGRLNRADILSDLTLLEAIGRVRQQLAARSRASR